MFRLLSIAFGAIIAMSALAAAFTTRLQRDETAQSMLAGRDRVHHADKSEGEEALALRRDGSGQFHLTGTSHGEDVHFLIDTGADVVALTEETADRLGVLPPADAFQPIMKTASGTGYGAPITIDTLSVAGAEFHDVEAVVMQGLGTDLLGQSLLRRLGKVELQGDSMVIRPS